MRTLSVICGMGLLCATGVQADLYQWTDTDGVIHIVDDAFEVPDAYRERLKVYRTATPSAATATAAPLSPGRIYVENSQGAFAQKLAVDLGLIKNSEEDALGPLSGIGIQPAGGWKVADPLIPEALYEILAAARRAADSKRLPLSADGAEAIVRQAAVPFLPPPAETQAPSPQAEVYREESRYDEEPEVVVIEQPPQVIEVIREPYYTPAPVIVGVPRPPHHHHHHDRPGHKPAPPPPSPSGPHTTRPGPTHLPFGTTHLPAGSSRPGSSAFRR